MTFQKKLYKFSTSYLRDSHQMQNSACAVLQKKAASHFNQKLVAYASMESDWQAQILLIYWCIYSRLQTQIDPRQEVSMNSYTRLLQLLFQLAWFLQTKYAKRFKFTAGISTNKTHSFCSFSHFVKIMNFFLKYKSIVSGCDYSSQLFTFRENNEFVITRKKMCLRQCNR